MRDLFYKELRILGQEIAKMKEDLSETEFILKENQLLDSIYLIQKYQMIASREGLLSLGELVDGLPKRYNKWMLQMFFDAIEPEDIEERSYLKYYALNLHGYEALDYFIWLVGTLSIQRGDEKRETEKILLSMIPDSASDRYEERKKYWFNCDPNKVIKDGVDVTNIQVFRKRMADWKVGNEGYFLMKALDWLIKEMNDDMLKHYISYMDNNTLTLVMRGMSAYARNRVFDVLPLSYAVMIANNMDEMPPVCMKGVIEEMKIALKIAVVEIDKGILTGNFDAIKEIFTNIKNEIPLDEKEQLKDADIYCLLNSDYAVDKKYLDDKII